MPTDLSFYCHLIPHFIISRRYPISPDALSNPGLVVFVHRVSGRSCIPPPPHPEFGGRRWPAGLEPGRVHWGLTLAKTAWAHPSNVHFSQDH